MRRQAVGSIATTLAERGAGSISAISPTTPPSPSSASRTLLSLTVRKTSTLPDRIRQQKAPASPSRSEEHTSELQSLMRISYAVFCLKKKTKYKKLIIVTH